MTAQEVAKRLESIYGREVHLTVQNGTDAGQTVKHAHIHVVPGKGGVERDTLQPRTPEDMAEEAEQYRPYFEQSMQWLIIVINMNSLSEVEQTIFRK